MCATRPLFCLLGFFSHHTATTEIYTLSLHDALPICLHPFCERQQSGLREVQRVTACVLLDKVDRKSTRLNSSHLGISYAVFCLKKKTNTQCDQMLKPKHFKTLLPTSC